MSRRHAVDCDTCPRKDIVSHEFTFIVGRSMGDPAGSGADDVIVFDICNDCLPKVARVLISILRGDPRNYALNQKIVDAIALLKTKTK